MSIYQRYCHEVLHDDGSLKHITLDYPDNFNFGYDVVDAIAAQTPEKTAIVWCNTEEEEHIFTFQDVKNESNRMANVFAAAGLKRGDRVMVVLKRHYEYWFATVAMHKLGITLIPATHMLTVSDFVYRIQASEVDGIICTPQNDVPQKIREALKITGSQCRLWCVQSDVEGFENLTTQAAQASPELSRVATPVSYTHLTLPTKA